MSLRTKARLRIWDPRMCNGHPTNVSRGTRRFIMRAVAAGLHITATSNGRHSQSSFHYYVPVGAADAVGTYEQMVKFQRREHRYHGRRYRELFGPDNNSCRKNGRPITLGEGTFLENLHDSHVHGACSW